MWASAALLTALALAPEPINQLKLTNERVCHGMFGWERKDSRNPKLLPGDLYILAFDIDGLTVSPEGRVKYTMAVDVTNKDNKVVFNKDPEEYEDIAGLGGRHMGANAQMAIGLDIAPGPYTVKVTVSDRAVKGSSTMLMRTFRRDPHGPGLHARAGDVRRRAADVRRRSRFPARCTR